MKRLMHTPHASPESSAGIGLRRLRIRWLWRASLPRQSQKAKRALNWSVPVLTSPRRKPGP